MIRFLRNTLGQTSVEYLLMVVVSLGLGMTFTRKAKDWFFAKPNGIFTKQLQSFNSQFGGDKRYKTFRVQRYK